MDFNKIRESAEYITNQIKIIPSIAVVLGSGLGAFAEKIEEKIEIPYSEIPGFSTCSVEGHSSVLVFGKLREKYVMVMQGRFHYYEGYSMEEISFPIWVFRAMGIKNLILTNAAGAINEELSPGDFCVITDHIKLTPDSPLRGVLDSEFGERFNDMSRAYTPELIEVAKEVAFGMDISLDEGVYAFMGGPQFETPAEIRMLYRVGADLVGMSTVPEVIVAAYTGMKVLAISCITNMAAGVNNEAIDHNEVNKIGEMIADKFDYLVEEIIERIRIE